MGAGLNRAFESSVLENAEDALRNQILLLMASVDVQDGRVLAPDVVSEPRLLRPDSDLYAQIWVPSDSVETQNSFVWQSPSLLDQNLPVMSGGMGEFRFASSQAWRGRAVNLMTLAVEWETDGAVVPFMVQVAESDESYVRRLAKYKQQVLLWLSVFGGALMILLLGMLGWTLKPLERVGVQVNEIEEGHRHRLDEDYPVEVSRLTKNLNQLLNYEERRIDRQKEVLGNLAHSLKTPIAVMSGLSFSREVDPEAREQLSAMQTIIDYQLQSASAVGRRRFSKAIKVSEPTDKILRSLTKLHSDKAIKLTTNVDPETVFFGDKGDWMEVVGNLCENAFKWCDEQVRVDIRNLETSDGSRKLPISIIVQDDGEGIDEAFREKILQRGVRLDSQTPGHGLGMHIVTGIVEAYEGTIRIEESDFGKGTKFHLVLA